MQCLDNTNCAATEAVKYMVPIELLPTSHCPGAIEAACKLMHDQVHHIFILRYLWYLSHHYHSTT